MNRFTQRDGQLSLQLLVFSAVTVIMISGFAMWVASFLNLSLRDFNRTSAFSIAEAGVEYYRWHLAHAPLDYQDGTGQPGPYVHNYYDKSGNVIGTFTLDITPPPTGSTIMTIQSTGKIVADASVTKIIRVKLGIPSLARYSVVANDNLRFGTGTQVFGEIMSNRGIRFDGIAYNIVRSALTVYDDLDHPGGDEFAVHTHTAPVDPLPPAAMPNRPDVFVAGREFPVPSVDFSSLTQDLNNLRAQATSSGVYATSSGVFGWDLVLNTNDTYTLYRVTTLVATGGGCANGATGWGSWSIQNETAYATGTIPANGIFFFEDHLWVRGQINGQRVTIASGRFPDSAATRTSITVNQDLLYTNYNGTDSIGLIAQNNFNVGMVSNNTLRIDGAVVAQNGRAGRFYYPVGCAPYNVRSTLTAYGMIASNIRYGFAYTDGTGYTTRNLIYDSNFLYGPPPSFPLSGSQYVQISWEEVQ